MTGRCLVLCDPGLATAPANPAPELTFWGDLVEWAADTRVRLGPHSALAVYKHFDATVWPWVDLPGCPPALAKAAHGALMALIGRAITDPPADPSPPMTHFAPAYLGTPEAGSAIGADSRLFEAQGPALATNVRFWGEQVSFVEPRPTPPEVLELCLEPFALLESEAGRRDREHYSGRRITIIGGWETPHVRQQLQWRFGLTEAQLRWRPSERNADPNISCLDGVSKAKDVVICVTGYISHASSNDVETVCAKRSVEVNYVRRVGAIGRCLADLASRDSSS